MSLSSLYNSSRRSLQAYQAAANVTGQNIANAETPGYTRQRVGLRQDLIARGGLFFHGPGRGQANGVGVGDFERVRSQILDSAARRAQSGAEGAGLSAYMLSAMEQQLAPDGGDALLGSLGRFWGAWSDVADNPASLSARDALISAGGQLAGTLRSADERMQAFGDSVESDLGDSVEQANRVLGEIAVLNGLVRRANASGTRDADAEDRRDALLDELSALAPIQVRPQGDGMVTVSFGGMVGVQGTEALPISLALPPDVPTAEVRANGSTRAMALSSTEGGVLGAQLHLLNTAIPGARAGLDGLAAALVERVNALHTAGTGLDGGTGRSFFDPAGVTASTLALSTDLAGAESVAASASGDPGDTATATAIAGLGEDVNALVTTMLGGIGTQVRNATAASNANAAVADHAVALRDGISAVSIDEEMVNLIKYQQSYAASARVLETANSLFDTLMTL
jgi:flagellar hook-associated protein 1 FlgK